MRTGRYELGSFLHNLLRIYGPEYGPRLLTDHSSSAAQSKAAVSHRPPLCSHRPPATHERRSFLSAAACGPGKLPPSRPMSCAHPCPHASQCKPPSHSRQGTIILCECECECEARICESVELPAQVCPPWWISLER